MLFSTLVVETGLYSEKERHKIFLHIYVAELPDLKFLNKPTKVKKSQNLAKKNLIFVAKISVF